MGGRTVPTVCPHGIVVDWGDHGPDADDGTVGVAQCGDCEQDRERAADALVGQLVAEARKGCWCAWHRKPCPYHDGFADGLEAMLRALRSDG